jgi:hypothetical protein
MLILLAACQSPDEGQGPDRPDPSETTGEDTQTSETGEPTPTGDTAPELVEFDCASIPVQPTSKIEIEGAKGYHDLAFTEDGLVIGNNNGNFHLVAADYEGTSQVFVPTIGTIQQMAWLPGGDLAAASDTHGIIRISPSGGWTVINGNVYAYGLILGPDQKLYAADQATVSRIDPDTGDREILVEAGTLPRGDPRILQFGLGYTKLYMGTFGGSQGRLYEADLDETYTPTGPVRQFTDGVGTGDYHDGMGIDLCGYLYVPDYSTSALYRISPSGQVQKIHDSGVLARDYGHGVEWGNGIGGWRAVALYLPLPYGGNSVLEVVIGVPSRDTPGVVATNLP